MASGTMRAARQMSSDGSALEVEGTFELTFGRYPFSMISSLVRWPDRVLDSEYIRFGNGTSGKAAWIVSTVLADTPGMVSGSFGVAVFVNS